ncbi:MAG: ASCH domain-containing protein [Nanoarchaeota archaeon]
MKALSLKQPYAELIVAGKKKIELRNWNTKFRGRFLIHASQKPDKVAMKNFGFAKLPLGKIIGEAELADVKHYESEIEHKKDADLHLANESWGNFGFVLKNPKRLNPMNAKGSLGFWEFKNG